MSKPNRLCNCLLPRLQDILFISIFFAAILLGPRMLNMDGDLPRHLAIGKFVLQGNFPPINDIFSHTRANTPFAPHKWLSGVFFYFSYILFDERGIVILSSILLATTFVLIYSDGAGRSGLRLPMFFLTVWGAAISSLHWIARPHLFTMLLLAIWLILTEKLGSGKKIPLWYFPALMFLWNNIHGEFISGFLVTLACLGGWVWDYLFNRPKADIKTGKRIGLTLVLITVITILNPVSLRAWSTLTSWMGNNYLMSHTQETIPPDFQQGKFMILLAFLIFSIFLLAIKREKTPPRMAFILAGFSALVLLSARNVHLYGVAAPFALACTLNGSLDVPFIKRAEDLFAKIEGRLKGVVWPVTATLLGVILLAVTPLGQAERFSPEYFPVQAVEWIKNHPQNGEMFNPFDWGGYLSLELWPEKRVFIDSQGDIYGEAFIREYEQVITMGTGWQDILDKYHVSWALVPQKWSLADALLDEGWTEVYRDETAVILVRGK